LIESLVYSRRFPCGIQTDGLVMEITQKTRFLHIVRVGIMVYAGNLLWQNAFEIPMRWEEEDEF